MLRGRCDQALGLFRASEESSYIGWQDEWKRVLVEVIRKLWWGQCMDPECQAHSERPALQEACFQKKHPLVVKQDEIWDKAKSSNIREPLSAVSMEK